jgi:hypothetical protein
MTATTHAVHLPAIRSVRSLFAGHAPDRHRTGTWQAKDRRVYRLAPQESRNSRVYLQTAYASVEGTKGCLVDIFA